MRSRLRCQPHLSPSDKTYLTAWHTLHAPYQVVPVVAALVPVSSLVSSLQVTLIITTKLLLMQSDLVSLSLTSLLVWDRNAVAAECGS